VASVSSFYLLDPWKAVAAVQRSDDAKSGREKAVFPSLASVATDRPGRTPPPCHETAFRSQGQGCTPSGRPRTILVVTTLRSVPAERIVPVIDRWLKTGETLEALAH
jgi:hypothetical protein